MASRIPASVLSGHERSVISATFSADGRSVWSASVDGTLRCSDAYNGRCICVTRYAASPGRDVALNGSIRQVAAISSDGFLVAYGTGDRCINVADARTGEIKATFNGHTDVVTAVAFSRDGHYVASGSHDNTARVWHARSGVCRFVFHGHSAPVTAVAFSRDGSMIASAFDKRVHLWNGLTGDNIRSFSGQHTGGLIICLAFSPNCHTLAAGGSAVQLWNVDQGTSLTTSGYAGLRVHAVAFSPDGCTFATAGNDKGVHLWETSTCKCKLSLLGQAYVPVTLAFSPNARTILAGCDDGKVRIWDVADVTRVTALEAMASVPRGPRISPTITAAHGPQKRANASVTKTPLLGQPPGPSPRTVPPTYAQAARATSLTKGTTASAPSTGAAPVTRTPATAMPSQKSPASASAASAPVAAAVSVCTPVSVAPPQPPRDVTTPKEQSHDTTPQVRDTIAVGPPQQPTAAESPLAVPGSTPAGTQIAGLSSWGKALESQKRPREEDSFTFQRNSRAVRPRTETERNLADGANSTPSEITVGAAHANVIAAVSNVLAKMPEMSRDPAVKVVRAPEAAAAAQRPAYADGDRGNRRITELEQTVAALKASAVRGAAVLEEKQRRIAVLEKNVAALTAQRMSIEEEKNRLSSELDKAVASVDAKLVAGAEERKRRIAELESTVSAQATREKTALDEKNRRIIDLERSLASLDAQRLAEEGEKNSRIAELEAAVWAQRTRGVAYMDEKPSSKRELEEAVAALNARTAELDGMRSCVAELEAKRAQGVAAVAEKHVRILELEGSIASITAQRLSDMESMNNRISELEATVDAKTRRIVELETTVVALNERNAADLDENARRIAELEEAVAAAGVASDTGVARPPKKYADLQLMCDRLQGKPSALLGLSAQALLELSHSITQHKVAVEAAHAAAIKDTTDGGRECAVCFEREPNTVLIAKGRRVCNHVFCETCAEVAKLCPSCRTPVEKRMRLYIP
eukprot:Opistho-2@23260